MKTFYTTPMVASHAQSAIFFFRTIFSIFILSLAFSTAFSQSETGIENSNKHKKLKFKTPVLESGVAGSDNAIYRFSKVEGGTDAIVKIVKRSSPLVKLLSLDLSNTGHDEAFQPHVTFGTKNNVSAAAEWWMEFEISFVEKENNKPVQVSEFNVSGIDIDGNGHLIREYITFYGLKTYSFESTTLLQSADISEVVDGVSTVVGKRFDGPTINYLNIDTTGTAVMVTNTYEKTNKFRIRVGAVASAESYAADRMYSIYFKSFTYNTPVELTLPVKLQSFTASLNSKKVQLSWQSAEERGMSHYELERSVDGKSFKQAALIFSAEEGTSSARYNYTDKVDHINTGNVYYRLRMVDLDGKFTYSAIRVVNLNAKNELLSIATYPNPVQDQMQITIPKAWEQKQVVYEIYSNSGQMMQRSVSPVATQTETVRIGGLQNGMYTVKVYSGSEVAVAKIVKK